MSAAMATVSDALISTLTQCLEYERQLGLLYRKQLQAAWGPRVRRLWEAGWALKRSHDDALVRLLTRIGGAAPAEVSAPLASPTPRELLSSLYERERSLALWYQEAVRLTADPDSQSVLDRLADEQQQFLDRVRSTYRDYSAA